VPTPTEFVSKHPQNLGWEYVLDLLKTVGIACSYKQEGRKSFQGKMLATEDRDDKDFTVDWSDLEDICITVYDINNIDPVYESLMEIFLGVIVCDIEENEERKRLCFNISFSALSELAEKKKSSSMEKNKRARRKKRTRGKSS
jgi:hypothetical protein